MRARAPAKTILSGEHAVVYGQPALALALKRYAWVEIEPLASLPSGQLRLILSDLNQQHDVELNSVAHFQHRIDQRYQRFLAGELAIEQLLEHSHDLYCYALALCQPLLASLGGYQLTLSSDIPIGSGMGSSAATVTALIKAVYGWAKKPLVSEQLAQRVTRCEQLQHGRSSGLDPAVCVQGGLLRFEQGRLNAVDVQLDSHWYLIDSGRPNDSTGQCTGRVRELFADSTLWPAFGQACGQLEQALQQADSTAIVAALCGCHRLLCQIEVVPESIQTWIEQLQARGGAAKISGAGAISGEQAGLVLAYCPTPAARDWLEQQSYPWQAMEMDSDGAQCGE